MNIHIKNLDRYLSNNLLVSSVVFIPIWSLIFIGSDIINAGFNYLVDDHTILESHHIYTSFNDIIVDPFTSLFSTAPKSRFRPIYDVLLRLSTQIYGLNSVLWYLSSLLVAITTSIVFYQIGRLKQFSQIESIGFAGLIVFGQQSSTYTRFGTPETTATLFVALSFLFASLTSDRQIKQRAYDCLFIIFALLAALNKEACILILPALAAFKIWHSSQISDISLTESFDRHKYQIVFILGSFILFLAYIKLAGVSGPAYAGIDRDTLSIRSIFDSLLANGAIFGSALIANIGYNLTKKDRLRVGMSGYYISIALIIIPQLILYNKTGMVWHYVLPASIGVSLLTFYPIAKIRSSSTKPYPIVIGLVLTILAIQIIFTASYFQTISTRTAPIETMVSDIANCVRQNAPLAIVGNPYVDYESLIAFYKVTDLLIQNHQALLATYGSKNADLSIDALKTEEQPWNFSNSQLALKSYYKNRTIDSIAPQDLADLKGIVLTHSSKVEKSITALNLDWFNLDSLTKKYYPELDITVYCKQ
jgi:Dolichyl-phosphate-mannose-protein mannosyltransferase